MKNKGIYIAYDSKNKPYYRVAVTLNGHHVSLGNFTKEKDAVKCYEEYSYIMSDKSLGPFFHRDDMKLSFEKFISLINFRDNHIYISNPIYLKNNYFLYYLNKDQVLKFDKDDLFFYGNHRICKRGNRLFYNDFGIQITLKEKYGIPVYGIINKDYRFINDNPYDFRYSNIEIINKYHGVEKCSKDGRTFYKTKIHLKGYITVGTYQSELEACIAYNKAIDVLNKNYNINYKPNDPDIPPKQYADIYSAVKISSKLYNT